MSYGAVEFSRDTDIAVLASAENLDRLRSALEALQAECIAVPPFDGDFLQRGHAIHFRCRHPEAENCRLDVMAVMRGVAAFDELWERRTTVETGTGLNIEVMSLQDLVQAKKTQRDKDWPMIRRLVDIHYKRHRDSPNQAQVLFWLRECRSVPPLLDLGLRFPDAMDVASASRPLLRFARLGDENSLTAALDQEEKREREADRLYWLPLRAELEKIRHKGRTR